MVVQGWCAGQDVELAWIYDITHWINPTGASRLLYQGLFDGSQYQGTSTNPYIVGRGLDCPYEHNITNENSGAFNSNDSPVMNEGMLTENSDINHHHMLRD